MFLACLTYLSMPEVDDETLGEKLAAETDMHPNASARSCSASCSLGTLGATSLVFEVAQNNCICLRMLKQAFSACGEVVASRAAVLTGGFI